MNENIVSHNKRYPVIDMWWESSFCQFYIFHSEMEKGLNTKVFFLFFFKK